jgi:hypothetical protein
MKAWAIALAAVGLASCGPAHPSIETLMLDRDQVTLGMDAYAIAVVHAPDGDVDRGQVKLKVTQAGGDTKVETTVPVMGVDAGEKDATIIVDFTLAGDFVGGAYDLAVIVAANDGTTSDSKDVPFTLIGALAP